VIINAGDGNKEGLAVTAQSDWNFLTSVAEKL